MDLLLTLSSPRRAEDLDQLTTELLDDLQRADSVEARRPAAPTVSGARGDVSLVGQILLTLVGGGGVGLALVGCLQAYIQRERSLSFTLKRGDGAELHLNAARLGRDETEAAFQAINSFIAGSNAGGERDAG